MFTPFAMNQQSTYLIPPLIRSRAITTRSRIKIFQKTAKRIRLRSISWYLNLEWTIHMIDILDILKYIYKILHTSSFEDVWSRSGLVSRLRTLRTLTTITMVNRSPMLTSAIRDCPLLF